MPQQLTSSVENNFIKGLITENTGLNFPENAATDTDNCEYTLIGEVLRRQGMNREVNGVNTDMTTSGFAINTYKWNNVGGDGTTQLVVVQSGATLYFYRSSAATIASPLSNQKISSTVDISSFVVPGGTFRSTVACEFADGNGYLFVYHPDCDPVYCTYAAGTVTGVVIPLQIRDFTGVNDGITDASVRPSSLTPQHQYNLMNQGWTAGTSWTGISDTNVLAALGSRSFALNGSPTGPAATQIVTCTVNVMTPAGFGGGGGSVWYSYGVVMSGTVTAYSGGVLTVNITSVSSTYGGSAYGATVGGGLVYQWAIAPVSVGYINTFQTGVGSYPSNADVWWYFKDSSGVYNPTTTAGNVTLSTGRAPRGHFILNAFTQSKSTTSGLAVSNIVTNSRPSNGTWFQGRVWYTGVNASQNTSGDANYYTWTENIYFSKTVDGIEDFGKCYQTNDPTSQNLFDLLPTDGGVIVIQGSGPIYRLFPTQNGLLVFAGNGVWFITGSQGIGFAANDYTVTKISSVQSISSTSFVDVLGLPYFWNEEGIYKVNVTQTGSLSVDPLTHTTILGFYSDIPLSSKKVVRGSYNPIDYVVQWVYRSTDASNTTELYTFDRALNFSTANQAFFPYSFNSTSAHVSAINYVVGVGGSNSPSSVFKYFTVSGFETTFSELNSTNYVDWAYTGTPVDYSSYLVTGYKIRGQAIKKYQPQYVQVWSNVNSTDSGYQIQGVWDYAINRNSNRYSSMQQAYLDSSDLFSVAYRRHKIRGHGYALQIKISSQSGRPFDLIGWAIVDTVNTGT